MSVMKKNISRVLCLAAVVLGLSSCGEAAESADRTTPQTQPVTNENTITYQLLEEPELSYELPVLVPGLTVPSGGYDVAEEKKAYAYGTLLPEEFMLVEKESGEVVYTGAFSQVKYHKDTESYSAVADFTEFSETGEYVLKCELLGYSYPFCITEGLQENMLQELLEGFEELLTAEGDGQSKTDGLLTLLLSYEIYPEAYETEEGAVPEVLTVVQSYVDALVKVQEEDEEQPEDPYMQAALFAKFGNNYISHDWNAGNDAMKRAKNLWKSAEKEEKTSEYRLLAAAELYKATGTYSYRKVVQEYFEAQLEGGEALKNRYEVLAALTHFTTNYKVTRSLCTDLMRVVLDKAEESYGYISLDNQLLGMGGGEEKLDEIMWNMVVISVVEYVITNYEYGDLLEEEFFYLQGRNPYAADYVNTMVAEHPEWRAAYVMLLCEHLAHDHLK